MSNLIPLSKLLSSEYLSEKPSSILAKFSESVATKFDQLELYFVILVRQHSMLLHSHYIPYWITPLIPQMKLPKEENREVELDDLAWKYHRKTLFPKCSDDAGQFESLWISSTVKSDLRILECWVVMRFEYEEALSREWSDHCRYFTQQEVKARQVPLKSEQMLDKLTHILDHAEAVAETQKVAASEETKDLGKGEDIKKIKDSKHMQYSEEKQEHRRMEEPKRGKIKVEQ